MSDSEEEVCYGFYGKPLEQYDEESIPKKRPISVEEQIATDAQGRRRFHGAFTGGFSAGFYNTVGSLEGWKPSEFKSSRSEKADNKTRRPEDYMDDEDVGEFGIAPQTVRATDDYNTSKKRKRKVFSDGPIPGEPVLHTLIEKSTETIGYILLRNLGFKHSNNKDIDEEEIELGDESKKVYGCVMPKSQELQKTFEITKTSLPEIYKKALTNPKANTFGLGYSGLDKVHGSSLESVKLVMKDRNNKKLSISGQAFGVGAFEDDDEDIYVKDDLSKYDFELTAEGSKIKKQNTEKLYLDFFVPSKTPLISQETFLPPAIPQSFTGKYKKKKSRFEPIITTQEPPKRSDIDAATRASILGEPSAPTPIPTTNEQPTSDSDIGSNVPEKTTSKKFTSPPHGAVGKTELLAPSSSGYIFDRFVSASKKEDHLDMLEPVQPSHTTHGTKDMREAARMKMFGPLTRVTISWVPNGLLCKRFNIPEPVFSENEMKPKARKRNLIFENETFTPDPIDLNKAGLQIQRPIDITPQIIPQESAVVTAIVADVPPVHANAPPEPVAAKTPIDVTDKIDVSKNVDLFKAVFMDSDSEEETETTENETETRQDTLKEQVLSQELLLPKIRPIKEGILSDVDFSSIKRQPEKPEPPKNDVNPNLFGPKLPEKIDRTQQVRKKDVESEDEWVEKGHSPENKERRHRKKSKKEKHKKKHKVKDKRR